MRIGTTSGPNRADRRARVGTSNAAPGFSQMLEAGEQTGSAGTVSAPPALAAPANLMAVQEVEDREARRRQLINHGDRLLDMLTDLRNGLIMGGLSRATIETISQTLEARKAYIDDPGLLSLIQDIEVRAAVELAKIEIATQNQRQS